MQLFWEKANCHFVKTSTIDNELLHFFAQKKHPHSSYLLISDQRTHHLYAQELIECLVAKGMQIHSFILPIGEQEKNIENAYLCWSHMQQCGMDRRSLVIGFGGGVVTDFSGYIASCYMRGVDLVLIPTTLLGMVDASIGGKTAVNLPQGKNLIGTFYPASLVLFNTAYLKSLSDREFRAGLAEVIKYGIVFDASFFCFLEANSEIIIQRELKIIEIIVEKSCKIKVNIVERDERDYTIRAILNWGHTFAHAIESATEYTTYLHGEAVAIGMSCAAYVSHQLGLASPEFIERQDRLCQKLGLSTVLPDLPLDLLIDLMAADKKAVAGAISLIVAREIGDVFKMDGVDRNLIKEALQAKRRSC